MRTAIYVRVSTSRQAQAQTIEQQLDRLRTHVQEQGEDIVSDTIFRDDGYSGATLNRPGLDRLRDTVRAGAVERVLVTDPDRLARNYVQLMVLLEELEHHGCQVEFLDRPMGRDPQDQLLLQIRGAVAEYERTLIAERMRRGRQMKLRAGCLLPWTRAPWECPEFRARRGYPGTEGDPPWHDAKSPLSRTRSSTSFWPVLTPRRRSIRTACSTN